MRGAIDLALDYYQRATAADEHHSEAQYNFAVLLERLGRPDDARPHYLKFLRDAPPEYAHLFDAVRAKLAQPTQ